MFLARLPAGLILEGMTTHIGSSSMHKGRNGVSYFDSVKRCKIRLTMKKFGGLGRMEKANRIERSTVEQDL